MAWLRQRDGVTCGPSVAVMAGALIDADYGAALEGDDAQQTKKWESLLTDCAFYYDKPTIQ